MPRNTSRIRSSWRPSPSSTEIEVRKLRVRRNVTGERPIGARGYEPQTSCAQLDKRDKGPPVEFSSSFRIIPPTWGAAGHSRMRNDCAVQIRKVFQAGEGCEDASLYPSPAASRHPLPSGEGFRLKHFPNLGSTVVPHPAVECLYRVCRAGRRRSEVQILSPRLVFRL